MKLREVRKSLSDLRAGDEAKLVEGVTEMKREQFNLRFQRATGQLDKPLRMREVRRMVARAKTVLREKRPSQKV